MHHCASGKDPLYSHTKLNIVDHGALAQQACGFCHCFDRGDCHQIGKDLHWALVNEIGARSSHDLRAVKERRNLQGAENSM